MSLLFWLGALALPLLHGLPQPILPYGISPIFASTALQRLGQLLTYPIVCLVTFTVRVVFQIWIR